MNAAAALARWTAGSLARLVGADLEGEAACAFGAVTTDSRESREGAAFFALEGTRVRGADFASAAFGSGCSVVVVPRDWTGEIPPGRAVLRHDDPLAVLARLAESVRGDWSCPVLAVTGSSGKTTVKEMTAHLLEPGRRLLRSPGNFNTVVGVARTILAVERAPDLAVLEVGASRPGEIAWLARIVRPTGACIVNVGPAHLEGFGTLEAIAREKVSLLRAVPPEGPRVIEGDDPVLAAAASDLAPLTRCGLGPGNELRAVDLEPHPRGTRFRIEGGPTGELAVPGLHQVRNALLALALARAHGVTLEEGLARLARFAGVPGRLTPFERDGVVFADDTYNANPASVRAALAWLAGVTAAGRKAVVLGDMLELGAASPAFHRDIGREVAKLRPELAVFVGTESRAGFEEAAESAGDPATVVHVGEAAEAARLLREWLRPGDVVLVKGSRGMRLERVVAALRGEEGGDAG